MQYDYSLIEITKRHDADRGVDVFAVDASLFIEHHWGKEALGGITERNPEIEKLLDQPFDGNRVDEIRTTFGDWLISTRTAPAAAEPTSATETEVTIELNESVEPHTLGFDAETVDRISKMQFQIHNTVRGRHNRAERAAAPVHARLSQFVTRSQIRVVRSRPRTIGGKVLLANLKQLHAQQQQGVLEVRTLHGQRLVDLKTLDIAPSAISQPKPNPPQDSAKLDRNQGIGEFVPPFQGALPVTPSAVPVSPIPPTLEKPMTQAAQAMLPPALPTSAVKRPDEKKVEDKKIDKKKVGTR